MDESRQIAVDFEGFTPCSTDGLQYLEGFQQGSSWT